jgi:hypothetical protein
LGDLLDDIKDWIETEAARWRTLIYYRSEHGTVTKEYPLEELADLHDLVELGPHWDTIERIEVFRINHLDGADLTLEGAAVLGRKIRE